MQKWIRPFLAIVSVKCEGKYGLCSDVSHNEITLEGKESARWTNSRCFAARCGISRLYYCTVLDMADGGCAGCLYYYAEFSGEILFSIPLMIRHISLLELQLWLSVVYALCPCRMRRERLIGLQNHANSIYCINHVGLISVAHQAVFLFIISLRSDWNLTWPPYVKSRSQR